MPARLLLPVPEFTAIQVAGIGLQHLVGGDDVRAREGDVVIESFTPAVTSIAGAVCLWRPVAPDQDTIASEGMRFLRATLG